MPHELEVITQAIDRMLVNERNAATARRQEEYGAAKSSFYPSEFGDGDRKIVYKFFADKIGKKSPLTGQNVRVFDNGDYVHLRYLDYLRRLGAVLSWESTVKSTQHEMEGVTGEAAETAEAYKISGRYDQVIDLHVIRAYLEGEDVWEKYLVDNFNAHTIVTQEHDKDTGDTTVIKEEVRWVPKDGYEPDRALIDIKSMNPWGFKRIIEKNDHSEIQGYFDQLNYYEDRTGIHKGALIIEDKEKQNLICVPVDYDPNRINGGGPFEGMTPRLARLWDHVKNHTVPEERCPGANRSKFPCMWSTGQCEFFNHCWNEEHEGRVIPTDEEEGVEMPTIEELVEYLTVPDYGVAAIRLYLQGFPGGQDRFVVMGNMPQQMLEQLFDYYADYVVDLDYLDADGNPLATEDEETSEAAPAVEADEVPLDTSQPLGVADNAVTDPTGEFYLEGNPKNEPVLEHKENGERFIICGNCQHKLVYQVLRGGKKQCPKCKHENHVITKP